MNSIAAVDDPSDLRELCDDDDELFVKVSGALADVQGGIGLLGVHTPTSARATSTWPRACIRHRRRARAGRTRSAASSCGRFWAPTTWITPSSRARF
eukprot:6745196-Prymnesium_polylepis.1